MNYSDPDLKNIIINALKEDIGAGDITTTAFIPKAARVKAMLLVKEPCVICGLNIAQTVFKTHDKKIKFKPLVKEGSRVNKGRAIASICGNAQSILTAERTALNFLTHLSGVATTTRKFVEAIKPYRAKIIDTRKTTPGLRLLQKYAVRIGGGFNHRFGLDEMIMIKDNHLVVLGAMRQALPAGRQAPCVKKIIGQVKKGKYRNKKIEIEVKNLREFKKALAANPDIIMLDNMSIKDIKKAVKMRNDLLPTTYNLPPKLEASGGISLKNIKKAASTGVDIISIGALTHSPDSVDISLEIL